MDFQSFYARNAASFVEARGLRMADLHELAIGQYDDAESVLLTSSAVHGIANATSDIDLICIRRGDVSDAAMATQLHCGNAHLEVVAFTRAQLQQAGMAVRDMAALPLPARAAAERQWGQHSPVARKYLERIATGVDAQGKAPYLHLQAPIAGVWAAAGVDQSRQCALFCLLACRAGERRAAVGYATNALLFAMNALLSAVHWPLLNKKWTLKRWHMAVGLFPESALMQRFHAPLTEAWQANARRWGSTHDEADGHALATLIEQIGTALGAPGGLNPRVTLTPAHAGSALLPGARVVRSASGDRAALLPEPAHIELPELGPAALLQLPQRDAAFWLGAARAGTVSLCLGDSA